MIMREILLETPHSLSWGVGEQYRASPWHGGEGHDLTWPTTQSESWPWQLEYTGHMCKHTQVPERRRDGKATGVTIPHRRVFSPPTRFGEHTHTLAKTYGGGGKKFHAQCSRVSL